jgi:carboxyl-terminal processing protease
VVAYEEDSQHRLTPLPILSSRKVARQPLAVLVDSGTASAAEITAGALRDYHRAVIIGTRTYGKGSMQSVYSLADGSTVRITDRLWLTPDKRSIQTVGIQPDIMVQSPASAIGATDAPLSRAERVLSGRGK